MREMIADCGKLKIVKDNGKVAVVHPGSVAVLPVLDVKDETGESLNIILVKQNRPVVDGGIEILEIPAGMRDIDGESPRDCALRELEEETGYRAGRIALLSVYYPTCGYSNELQYLYVATDLTPTGTKIEEDIETVQINSKTLRQMIRDGIILDAKTITAMYCALAKDNFDPEEYFEWETIGDKNESSN